MYLLFVYLATKGNIFRRKTVTIFLKHEFVFSANFNVHIKIMYRNGINDETVFILGMLNYF